MEIVIIGGVAAGAKVAAKTRRLLPDAEINLYTDDNHVSYSSCGLPYYIQGNFTDYTTLLVRSPEEFEAQNIHIHLKNKVIKILPELNQILIQNFNNGNIFKKSYDKLVIATGASPIIPNIKNICLKNIFTIRKIEDGIAIREKALKSKYATIIGSGYIGLELLESFTKLGLNTKIIERSEFILPTFDSDFSELILKQLTLQKYNNFKIITSEEVLEFTANEKGEVNGFITKSGKSFYTDFVVICTGVTPNSKIAEDAGLKLGQNKSIKVNRYMQTNINNIYACGDCAEKSFLFNGYKMYVPLGSTANKEGNIVALNLSGSDENFAGILASSVVRCLNLTMSKTGLTEKMATEMGFNPLSVTITKNDKVGFMPNVDNITLKLVADKNTGLLLGGQAIGSIEADKRIDTLTAALLGHLTIEQFKENDLTYAPPYSPTIDILLNAADILYNKYKQNL